MKNKTAIITGGNSGLGYQCALNIARAEDWHVVIASRNLSKSQQAAASLHSRSGNPDIQAMQLDLASLASVRDFAAGLDKANLPPLHVLVCNAGVQYISGTRYTHDGFEMTFGVNHLGHFLLTQLLLPHLITPARILLVSSSTHDPQKKTLMPPAHYTTAADLAHPQEREEDNQQDGAFIGRQRYSTSKLCNILFTYELARRLQASGRERAPQTITANAFDPGLMAGTGLAQDYSRLGKLAWSLLLPLASPFMGMASSDVRSGKELARLAIDPQYDGVSGKYFNFRGEAQSSQESYDRSKALDLWQTSMALCGLNESDTLCHCEA